MAYLNYTTKTTDTTDDLINLGLNEYGLIIDGQKTTPGAPDTNTEKYVAGAFIQNIATSLWYQNTGSTVLPIWTVVSGGGGGNIVSINGDVTPAQVIAAGAGIGVATVAGTTTITNTSTGTIGGTIDVNEIGYGSGLDTLTSDALFTRHIPDDRFTFASTVDLSNGIFYNGSGAPNPLGNHAGLGMDFRAGTVGISLGWSGTGNGTYIDINDIGLRTDLFTQDFYVRGYGAQVGIFSEITPTYSNVTLGDVSLVNNSTRFVLDDANSQVTTLLNGAFVVTTTTGNQLILSDFPNGDFAIGDLSGAGNANLLWIEDDNNIISLRTPGYFHVTNPSNQEWLKVDVANSLITIGDISSVGNDTLLTVKDSTREIISSTQQLGIGARVGISPTSAGLEYSDGVGTWSWFADDTSGGTLSLQAGTTIWNWPQADGLTGQVLTTDGAGNLDFAYAGTGDIGALNVRVATTAVLPGAPTYNNGVAGVGATLTRSSNGTLGTIDGITPFSIGDRILVKNQASTLENGVYEVTTVGSAGVPYVLTRTTDADTTAALDDMVVIASLGTTNKGIPFGQQTNNPTIGVSALVFTQTTIYIKQQTSGTQAVNQIPVYTATARTLTKGTSSFTYSPTTNLLSIGGVVRSSDLHNNALAQGNATQQDIRSGTYTPTGTVGTNVTSVTPSAAQWLRVGNVVTVSGHTLVNVTAAATCDWELSIPVNSTWSGSGNVGGTALRATGGTVDSPCFLQSTTNNRVQFLANTTASGIHVFSYQYTYVVI